MITDRHCAGFILKGQTFFSSSVMKKSPVVPLRCPRTLQEEDFLNLLRSSVPQLSDKPFDLLTSDRRRRLRRRTPADIQRVFSCAGLRASTLYVRLKVRPFSWFHFPFLLMLTSAFFQTQEDPLQLLQAPQTDVRLPAVHAVQEAGRHSRYVSVQPRAKLRSADLLRFFQTFGDPPLKLWISVLFGKCSDGPQTIRLRPGSPSFMGGGYLMGSEENEGLHRSCLTAD